MTQPAAIGLTPEEVSHVFPFHLGFDEHLRIVQLGPSLIKLAPGAALGVRVPDLFAFEPPHPRTFAGLCRALEIQAVLRVVATGAQLRGQLVLSSPAGAAGAGMRHLLFLCSPWLSSPAELGKLGLQLTDFALHAPMTELLQVLRAQEASLEDVRKLMTRLAAQRREERAGAARMSALHEVTGILTGGRSADDVAQPVLEQVAAIVRFPVAALWLADAAHPYAHVVPGASADRSAQALTALLRAAPLELRTAEAWQPVAGTAGSSNARDTRLSRLSLELAGASGGRLAAALALGFTVAYRVTVVGAAGPCGAIETYGAVVPAHERVLLELLAELALRLGQFVGKTRAESALRGSIRVAAAAAAAKRQFLAQMGQELRAPVKSVLGWIELTLGGELAAPQRDHLEHAHATGQHLLTQIDDVIELSQLEAGRLEIHNAPFDLHVCLRRVNNLFAARAAAKHLSLGLTIDPRLPEIARGDELRLSQVLINLVGNAIKFTRTGSVHVAAHLISEDDDVVTMELAVRDTGVGVPEARRELIFMAFAKPESSASTAAGAHAASAAGSGLGLALCRQLVELMGGALSVTDNAGGGSVFRFSVVLERVAQQHQRPVTARLRVVPLPTEAGR